MQSNIPAAPVLVTPDPNWEHYDLFARVKEAIYSLPFYFKTETIISGIMATDIFTLNATLGATIEEQLVRTLNEMRPIWDPYDKYRLYGFVRQPQTFPDVLLRSIAPVEITEPIILGLELKGWYLLAKEGEPSFRFTVTPSACNVPDMIVVVPWALSNVIAGSPRVFQPYVESAQYAAEYRNYHWQHLRRTEQSTEIRSSIGIQPYPRKSDQIADRPIADSGGNFGRLARTGIMDEYINAAKSQSLCGIEAQHWLAFFKIFQEQRTNDAIRMELNRLAERVTNLMPRPDEAVLTHLSAILTELEKLVVDSTQ